MENSIPVIPNIKNIEDEKETQTKKGKNLTVIQKVLLISNPEGKSKPLQTLLVCFSFLLMGVVRTAQGPSLLDLKNQVKATLQDFKLVFSVGSFTFPFGNLVGAFIIRYFNSLRFLSLCMLLFAITNTAMVFSPSLYALVATFGLNELIMGLVDSACNIAILQIWGSKSDPYFTTLHFCLGIGNLLGPIITELFLTDDEVAGSALMANASRNALISNDIPDSNVTSSYVISESVLTPVENDVWQILFKNMALTDLQGFHGFLGLLLLGAAFMDLLVSFLPLELEVMDKGPSTTSQSNVKSMMKKNYLYMLLVGAMTVFAFCGNGIYFLIGNFITVHGLNSPLQMSKTEGARSTAIFFAASVVSKFIGIIAVDLIKDTFILILVNTFFLSIGSWFLLTVGDTSMLFYRIGIAVVGFGVGTHFSMGLLWLSKVRQLNEITTSILLIATSVGAQVFKIPASRYITTFPSLLYYITLGSWAVIIVTIITSKILASAIQRKKQEPLMNRHVFRRDSDSTTSSGSFSASIDRA